jgi:DNA-binding transcriptional ArsR family regulator
MARHQDPKIRDFILHNVGHNPDSIASLAAQTFGLSRTGIGRYMARLVEEGLLTQEGQTRGRRYALKVLSKGEFFLERDGTWSEDNVWREKIRPLMTNVRQNVIDICQYGVTEMVNNVLDHSQSPSLITNYRQTYVDIIISICDFGVGIFNKIQRDFKLDDARTALLELSKGKLTSDKKHHSGEGVYFTSRMFDYFSILSGYLYYGRTRTEEDDGWLIDASDKKEDRIGTFITMRISTNAEWSTRDVFEKYQGGDIYFRKTHIPITLGKYPGEQLISRSQAKRVLTRLTDFSEVILDFRGVTEIGQAFADEIFRVFRNQHPGTLLFALNANERVQKMFEYVEKNGSNVASPTSEEPFGDHQDVSA